MHRLDHGMNEPARSYAAGSHPGPGLEARRRKQLSGRGNVATDAGSKSRSVDRIYMIDKI